MLRNRFNQTHIENSFSSSFWSDEEFEREHYPYHSPNEVETRMVWVTNYMDNEDFTIQVPAVDPLVHGVDRLSPNNKDDRLPIEDIHHLDLSKLNLDGLLILLYRLQQKTARNLVISSTSNMSSSSSSSASSSALERQPSPQLSTLHSLSPALSHAVQSSLSMLKEILSSPHSIDRRQSFFNLSDIANVPKQLTTTLAKPVSSFHAQLSKHIHSPNDVVNKLLQSFHLRTSSKLSSPSYTYQDCQEHKARLVSTLLSPTLTEKLPRLVSESHFSV